MRTFFIATILVLLFCSCAHSQKAALPEARQNVAEWKPVLHLSYQQVKQMEGVETAYLKKYKVAQAAGNSAEMEQLKKQRNEACKKILSREQYIKYQALENKLIKKVPLRS